MSAEVSLSTPPSRVSVGVNVDLCDLVDEGVEEAVEVLDDDDEHGLVERWAALQARAKDLQRIRSLQQQMAALKDELLKLAARVADMESDLQVSEREQLEECIQTVKNELASLNDRKSSLLELNVAVHSFLTDSGDPAAQLKDDVADLYRVWDETYQRVSQQLENLQQVSAAWQQFELHLAELQVALRNDQDTLRMVDRALQGGQVSTTVASSVRDVARVLSEKQENAAITVGQSSLVALTVAQTAALRHTEGGSLSDSGISDSGSDQELSERERRLAGLRRLVRHLEAILTPSSKALNNMAKRMEQTETELRGLQRRCRDLIVRTAVCVEAASAAHVSATAPGATPNGVSANGAARSSAGSIATSTKSSPTRGSPEPHSRSHRSSNGTKWRKTSSSGSRRRGLLPPREAGDDPDDPEPGKGRPRHWLWRAMRAALPFQMAIMALLCVACLLEPHCCDAINNLNLSLSPQLRYVRGPPPV